ncbi:gamma-glutamyltransferase family protein [Fervidibacillus halotolerans]|uniref:Gamma-glutamyltransferase family protein n=1 Tax=Fervidibacillus halotolerans TaxID=2980027 RepID=A0A9E8LYC0_9BACI|nr:gamma-glutamyltransferase family protein [Fervidibacillus halotolerans]WAA12013.1 gamma-glutamyltransferase family protein [Fervidibacillus halotolerans]
MDFLHYPYASQRMTMFAKRGMVATSHPLASQAGLDILKKGGNAVDAAIATAAALTVVEPTSNGIGGDAFAIVWMKDKLHGLNSSGPSPKSISIDAVKERGYEKMPTHGVIPVTVPGVPAAWVALSKRFGKLPLSETLKPAITYAQEGYPISPTLGKYWNLAYKKYKQTLQGDEFLHWFETFAPDGRPPKIGELWRSEAHANTLQTIAETNGESFYKGELAEKIDAFFKKHNGFLTKDDLSTFEPIWVNPIHIHYRGYDIWEIPPNGQGIVALMALSIVKEFEFHTKDDIETYHKQIEALKLAMTDGKAFITDPQHMEADVNVWLSEKYGAKRREQIGKTARMPEPLQQGKSGTVYLATADEEGNMVSYIQSNYMGFGSGIVIPDTGIAMQNRGADFSLDSSHPNALQPGKRTYHTIIPGFITKGKAAIGPFGVMGGYMQPQGHMQVVMNMIDFHLNPQAALDAPRWQWIEGKRVIVEPNFPNHIAQGLARKGHEIQVSLDHGAFGRGQIIWRDPKTGVLIGGTEKRTDSAIAIW